MDDINSRFDRLDDGMFMPTFRERCELRRAWTSSLQRMLASSCAILNDSSDSRSLVVSTTTHAHTIQALMDTVLHVPSSAEQPYRRTNKIDLVGLCSLGGPVARPTTKSSIWVKPGDRMHPYVAQVTDARYASRSSYLTIFVK